MTETEAALRAEVLGVCKTSTSKYRIKLSTKLGLRLLLYLGRQKVSTTPQPFVPPPLIASKIDTPLEVADPKKGNPKVPPSSSSPPKVAKQPGVNEKETEVTKEVAPNATKPLATP